MNILNELKKIPNLITLSRLICAPILLYLGYIGNKKIFGILFLYGWISDGLDGFIAKKFNMTSNFGAKFDSFADDFSAIFVVAGIYFLFPNLVKEYGIYILIALVLLYIGYIFRIKKAKNIGIHLYSSKISYFLSGFLLLWTLFIGFSKVLFYVWVIATYWCNVEVILVSIFKKNVDENTKSLFF